MLYHKEGFEVYEIPLVLEGPLWQQLKVAELIAVWTESDYLIAIFPEFDGKIVIRKNMSNEHFSSKDN